MMRIYIAHDTDTLRTIARKTNCAMEALAEQNPAITDSNVNLAGMQVRLPTAASDKPNINLPICPPLPIPTSPYAEWIPLASLEDMQFSFSGQDQAAIHDLYHALRDAVAAMKLELYGDPPICLLTVGKNLHEVGTCQMGHNPATSAANPYGQIHHISGLYVADNSVLPHTGAANPTLTTVAVAIRTADHIIFKLRQ